MNSHVAGDIFIDNNDIDEGEETQINDNFEKDEDEPDFMDNSGKCWEFASKIEDEKHLKEWCQNKMGRMIVGKEEKLTRQFHCQIKECKFKAIFLKSCSIIYTRNKHNHSMENAKNIRQKKQEKKTNSHSTLQRDYTDRLGKLWHFRAQIGNKNISQDKLLNKFGFTGIHRNNTTSINLHCQRSNPAGGKCPFIGIYLKSNGCLYTRGEHVHTKRGKTPENVGDDYIDYYGKIFKFNKQIGKNIQHEMLRSKFGFTGIRTKRTGLNLRCEVQRFKRKCKFVGIYLKSNGCLYTRGKHEHEDIEKNPKPNVGDDFVDYAGKTWPFHSKIGKNIPNGIWRSKFGFTKIQQRLKSFNLYCWKETSNGGKCPFRGIYLKSNGCVYIQGKHEHK